jgi:triosephosphate isomerase (TIM)
VWAIGTGKTATADDAQAMGAVMRSSSRVATVRSPTRSGVLYGGSMKPENAAELLAKPDVDGGLIGGASLKRDQYLAIAAAAP